MTHSFVFVAIQPRLHSLLGRTLTPSPLTPKSHGIISFADPHTLNLYATILYKKGGGEGHVSLSGACPQSPIPSLLNYLLMSSFASKRLSNGWRKGFVASGAALIACVISLAAVGKSPEFDESRASARWLTQ